MITSKQPVVADGSATKKAEIWPMPGDEFQVLHICPLGALHYFGVRLDPLTSVVIRMTAGIVGSKSKIEPLLPPGFAAANPENIDDS